MTAAERLLSISKATGAAGALLLAIGSGATAEAALLDYSALESVTAAEHILYEKPSAGHGGGSDSHVNLVKLRESIKRAQEERDRLEAERIAEIEREASEVLARIARANEPEPSEAVVIQIPEAIEPEQVAQVEPLAPVNDLVATFLEPLATLDETVTTFDELAIQNDNDTIALLLILAEID
jgi:hypothetical protein